MPVLTNQTNGEVSFMRWSSCENSSALNSGRDSNVNLDRNLDWDFLVQFPLLSKAFSYNPSNQDDFQTCRKLSLESCPSILICGTSKGYVSFYMSGYMAIGHINIGNLYSISSCVVKDVIFSPKSMSTLSVMASEPDSNGEETTVHLSFTGFPLIASCFSELCRLSETQSILIGTLDYMSDTLKQVMRYIECFFLSLKIASVINLLLIIYTLCDSIRWYLKKSTLRQTSSLYRCKSLYVIKQSSNSI